MNGLWTAVDVTRREKRVNTSEPSCVSDVVSVFYLSYLLGRLQQWEHGGHGPFMRLDGPPEGGALPHQHLAGVCAREALVVYRAVAHAHHGGRRARLAKRHRTLLDLGTCKENRSAIDNVVGLSGVRFILNSYEWLRNWTTARWTSHLLIGND